jgi:drug/metabolite transporter (DMT)-like permease
MNAPLLVIGTASGLSHSLYSAVSKLVLKQRVRAPFLFLLYVSAFQAAFTLGLWLFVAPALPAPGGWTPLLIAGGTCLLAFVFLYSALSRGDVSSVMPVMGSKVIFSAVLARVMLAESHRWPVYVAIVLVAVSVAALSYSPSKDRRTRFHVMPIVLVLACCFIFSITDVFIRRSLAYIDPYNFLVIYNLIVGGASLLLIPYLRRGESPLMVGTRNMAAIAGASGFLVISTLCFVVAMNLAEGIVVPNILMATRGVFIVLISLVLTHRGSRALDEQSKAVYALRFAASLLIVLAVAIALGE